MKIKTLLKEFIKSTNWDGVRCIIKGDPSIREIMGALKRQKELDNKQLRNSPNSNLLNS